MGYALEQNPFGPVAKWVVPWGKIGYALGQNVMCPGAKWVGPWG
jgi:hypothetical protein